MIPGLMKNMRIYMLGFVALSLLVCGILLGRRFRKPATEREVVYSRMEDVKQLRQLRVVTYYFESMVDVSHAEKADKVYLLMVIPARVSSYIDLEQMDCELSDSLLRVFLPEPVLEAPVLDLDSAKIFNLNQRYVTASKKSYETVVRNVQLSLSRAKEDVHHRALANGILDEARQLGEAYFRSLFGGLGFEIEFVSATTAVVFE
jgi:Protein of unknown function (DUF4230)